MSRPPCASFLRGLACRNRWRATHPDSQPLAGHGAADRAPWRWENRGQKSKGKRGNFSRHAGRDRRQLRDPRSKIQVGAAPGLGKPLTETPSLPLSWPSVSDAMFSPALVGRGPQLRPDILSFPRVSVVFSVRHPKSVGGRLDLKRCGCTASGEQVICFCQGSNGPKGPSPRVPAGPQDCAVRVRRTPYYYFCDSRQTAPETATATPNALGCMIGDRFNSRYQCADRSLQPVLPFLNH